MSVVQHSILNVIYRGFPRQRYITCNFKLEQQTNFIRNVHTAFIKLALSVNKHCRSSCAMNCYVPTPLFALQ